MNNEKPKRKRGRPRKSDKITKERGDNETKHKGNKKGVNRQTKKERDGDTENKQEKNGNNIKAMELSGEELPKSEGLEEQKKQTKRQDTKSSVNEKKSRKKCNKNRKSNTSTGERVKTKHRVMKRENYDEALRYLMLKKYQSKDIKQESRYNLMLKKLEDVVIV
jgi:hypothetical protein